MVFVKDANGCEISATAYLQEPGADRSVVSEANVYPNPSNQTFTAEYNGHFAYQIQDAQSGKVLEKGMSVDVAQVGKTLMPGVYHLRIEGNGGPLVRKLIKY
jgi:hypothetical protein